MLMTLSVMSSVAAASSIPGRMELLALSVRMGERDAIPTTGFSINGTSVFGADRCSSIGMMGV